MAVWRRRLLRSLGAAQRPIAWALLGLSLVALVAVLSQLWRVEDPVGSGLTILVLVQQAYASVVDVENELDTAGAAREDS